MKNTTKTSFSSNRSAASESVTPLKPIARSIAAWVHRPGAWSVVMGAMPALAFAQMPTGGAVVAGEATIDTPNVNHTVVQQSSNKAILNWQSFSVGSEGYVQFIQPGANSISLNRVVGSDPSSILGRLSSNGQVFLVNPNGVFFGANAVVDVAGIAATTMNIRDEDFMNGNYRFFRDPKTPEGATVINEGSIGANGGYVVLAGDYAANKGLVQAQLGTALLASGDALTLQLAGSSLINYAVDEATVAHLAGVSNSGQILANGGRVVMTADVANDLAATVVNNSGLIQAQSTVEKDGAIYFEGQGGSVANSGTLDASAQAGANGGYVDVRASGDIVHEAGSLIDVSGADTGNSDAGSVYTWADGTNRFKQGAAIAGKGGSQEGDGAFVELSGKAVQIAGDVDLRATHGKGGDMLIDPVSITITNASGTNDGSSIGEVWIENYLDANGGTLTILANGGDDAGITVEDLADNLLNGNANGDAMGGSLTLRASGGGNPSIKFNDINDTISVVGDLTLTVDDGAGGNAVGSIEAGNLQAGRTIDLKAGSISTGDLVIDKTINTTTDSSYSIAAQAYNGNLNVNGDVRIDVTNSAAAAVATDVSLTATGNVSVSGNISSKATGKGYYHYNWATTDGDATTYYGDQPWTLQNQGDHKISANLDVQAGGSVSAGSIDVLATDNNTDFTANGVGGYWQTATATQHNFWRATGANATATVDAGSDVTVSGKATVKADGYATSAYSETETYRTMVDNFNYTSGSQTVRTYGYVDGDYQQTGSTVNNYNDLKGSMKGAGGDRYIWSFGPYRTINGSVVDHSSNTSLYTDSSSSSHDGPMSYSGVAGLSSTLTLNAGGSVTLNGLDVRSINRSGTGSGTYTDTNWGYQDTAAGLNGTTGSFTSANREVDYYDSFSTSFTAATSTAQVNITAGDNQSVTLNGAGATYDVIASHPNLTASQNTLATAAMTITAGVAGGASGTGQVSLNGPIHVEGDDDASINLTVLNHDGGITQADSSAAILVKNNYYNHDARAAFTGNVGNVAMDEVTVNAGRNAYVDVTADQNVNLTGAITSTARERAEANLTATDGTLTTDGTIGATASQGVAIAKLTGAGNVSTNAVISASGSTQAKVQIDSSTALTIGAAISASASAGSGSAEIAVTGADGVTSNATLTASATAMTSSGFYPNITVNGGTASVNIGSAGGDVTLNDNVTANAYKNASIAVDANGGHLTIAADKSVAATASGAAFGFGYNYSYASDVDLTGASGMTLDGSVTATATNGSASVDVLTDGGSSAGIAQGAGSVVKADGQSASLTVKAGNATPNAANSAAITMAGDMQARGTTGTATLQVAGKSASVNNFSAISTGNAASAAITSLDGALTAEGTGTVSGNANNATGANLTMSATGVLDLQNATLSSTNSNTGASAGAQATLSTTGGAGTLGAASVSGYNTALLTGSANGNLSAAGVLSVTAGAASGTARIDLASSAGSLTLDAASALNATANASNGVADINLTGATGMALDGDATATATNGTSTIDMLTNDGSSAAVSQGAGSVVKADGRTASLSLKAGNATPNAANAAAIALGGDLQARGTTGMATLDIAGKSGSVANFSAASTGNAASATITTLDGALTANGTGTVSGNADSSTGANLTMTSSGALDTRTATLAATNASTGSNAGAKATLAANGGTSQLGAASVNGYNAALLDASASGNLSAAGALSVTASAASGTARIDLASGTGSLTLDATSALNATANASNGSADINLTGATGITANGSVTSTATNGTATVDLVTDGGSSAGITQGTESVVKADGQTAGVTVKAGSATPDASNAADITLAGELQARGTTGAASISVAGKSGSVSNFSAISTGNAASVELTSFDGALVANGIGTVTGNADSASGASLALASSSALDTRNATLTVTNSSTGSHAGAQATLAANGGANQLGAIDVVASKTATLNASGAANVSVNGTLSATASASSGTADIDLTGATGLTVDGNVTAAAANGTATVDLLTNGGSAAGVSQGSASVVKADGQTAGVTVKAGSATPDASNGAAIALAGDLQSRGTTGTANIDVAGKSGSMNNFSAISTGNTATASITTVDGSLVANGSGMVSGNADSSTGADLTLTSSGALDTRNATLTVTNNSTGSDAGAQAMLAANGGANQLGAIGVAASKTATLDATGAANLTANGALSATADAASGTADIKLTGATGLTVDGNVTATAANGAASVDLLTNGGSSAAISQGSGSTVKADGQAASVTVKAGSATPDASNAAAIVLAGDLQSRGTTGVASINVAGKSGSVKDFSAVSTGNAASVVITTFDGALAANGSGSVSGQSDSSDGASLTLTSAGALDASNASLSVSNTHTGASAGTQATLLAEGGTTALGAASVSTAGNGRAVLIGTGSNGLTTAADLSATAGSGAARIVLSSSQGSVNVGHNLDVSGDTEAEVTFGSYNTLTLNGNINADAAHGGASIELVTLGGSGAAINQGSASTVHAEGASATVAVKAGALSPNSSSAAGFTLAGALKAESTTGAAAVSVAGKSGSVKNFSASSTGNAASATVATYNGALVASGIGTVTGNTDSSTGASLTLTSAGTLDTRNATLTVANSSTGTSAGAKVTLAANGGNAQLGLASVSGAGGGEAAIIASALNALTTTANLSASASGAGSSLIRLSTTGTSLASSSITQNAGTTISATGNGGDAAVDIQAGACCGSTVSLNGTVESVVTGGTGDASVSVRGSRITVDDVKANVAVAGTGNALVQLVAPTEVIVNGTLDVQAADAGQRADIQLVSDRLTYNGGKAVMSSGNGHVQLAAFNTTRVIGVDSDRDFDANIDTNYALATLQKFVGNRAEIRFGGEVDRSAWTTGTPPVACVPGMDSWTSKLQQTANIHVAGNGRLDLGDVKMVFDTTGTTYYHDMQMSPWSVPAGRLAVFVARPNIDRYLDRTENTLQTMTKMVENAPGTPVTTGTAPLGSTPIQGNLFMAGDGVNTGTQLAAAGGAGANAGTGAGSGADAGTNAGTAAGTASDGAGGPSSDASEQSAPENDAEEREESERRRTSLL